MAERTVSASHFRAHARRAVRLEVTVESARAARPWTAAVVDVSLAGIGLELDQPLVPGERVRVSIATPTLWDPLVVPATVAWSTSGGALATAHAAGRARAGIRFEHESPESAFATWEMLTALVFD
jgi:hypothetical protein